MEDIYLVFSAIDGYSTMICKGNDIFNVRKFNVDTWIELLPIFVENEFCEDIYSASQSLYDLLEVGYKFKWETIIEMIKDGDFDVKRGVPFLLTVLDEMEGIEIKEISKYDKIYINPQTNERIKMKGYPSASKLYLNDVEIKGIN